MPGVVDLMELRKVSMVADDDSANSYTEPADAEKATIDRSAALVYFNSTHNNVVYGGFYY